MRYLFVEFIGLVILSKERNIQALFLFRRKTQTTPKVLKMVQPEEPPPPCAVRYQGNSLRIKEAARRVQTVLLMNVWRRTRENCTTMQTSVVTLSSQVSPFPSGNKTIQFDVLWGRKSCELIIEGLLLERRVPVQVRFNSEMIYVEKRQVVFEFCFRKPFRKEHGPPSIAFLPQLSTLKYCTVGKDYIIRERIW